jgi:S1-C subfamily serine protease
MESFGRGASLAALLATLTLTCGVVHAQGDAPPTRRARLGLAIAQLDEAWRNANSYRNAGLMVVGVDPRGRAAGTGIVAGDVLVSVGTRTMRKPSDLGYAERSLSPDQAVSVVLAREGGRLIKVLEILPVGAVPVVSVATTFAPEPPPEVTADEPAASPRVVPMATVSDSLPRSARAAADSSSALAGVVATTTSTGSEGAPQAAPSTTSGTADSATTQAASNTSSAEAERVTGVDPAAAGAAPSPTGAGTAGVPAARGTADAPVAGASQSAGGTLAAPVVIAAGAATAAAIDPGTSSGSGAPSADSTGAPPDSPEPAPVDLGVVGKTLTPDLATALGASGTEGILVLEVTAAGPADRSGMRAGDIIVKVGEQPVADMGELQRATAASASPVRVSTLRLGKARLEEVSLVGPPPTPSAPPTQEQLLQELRDEVRSLRREVQSLRKKLGK